MSTYRRPDPPSGRYGVTLEGLRERQRSLNMRLLLALENHNEEERAALEQKLHAVQREIDDMTSGVRKS